MNSQSYPCFYPGEFSPPTKYHLNTLHWLLAKPEIHHVNVVVGSDQPTQLSQKQKEELWDMLFKSSYAPQATILKAKQHGPISHIYETFNKDKKLPAYIALDEKSSRNKKLQEKFESFPYFGIQIIPSQFHKSSRNILSAAQQNNIEGVKKELPDDFSDDMVQKYMEVLSPKKQQLETFTEKEGLPDYKSRYTQMFNKEYWDTMFQPMAIEESYINEEIKEDIKKKALEKFKRENNALTDQQIMSYVNSFEKNMEKPVVKKKDILQYTWNELEQLVDGSFGTDIISKPSKEDIVDFKGSEDVVYNQNGLLILLGNIREKCIRYGQKYSWCISRTDANNMFYSYRMRMNEPVFYFIFDEDKEASDKYHAIVIYVNSQGVYTVADSTNSGDEEMSWEEIVKIQPKLKDLKSLIKHIPLTAEEKADYKKYKDSIDDETYKKYSYDQKYKYIQFGHDLTENQIKNTPNPLLSRFVSTGVATNMPEDIHDGLSGSDKKLLFKNRKEITNKIHNGEDEDTIQKLTILRYYPNQKVGNLEMKGDLYLTNSKLTELPDNLEVKGFLNLSDCTKLIKLPDNLKVKGYIDLSGCTELTKLPDNLEINSRLNLSGCTKLTELPDNLEVKGYLNLSDCTKLIKLPDNLKVGGSIYLSDCTKLTELPDNLEVKGYIDLSGCTELTKLPDNLEVGESLDLKGCTELTKLPDNLEVKGYLNLSGCTELTKLPDNLKVKGYLDLSGCTKLTKLPDNLEVGKSLDLKGCTELTKLPDNLKVKGYLNLSGCTELTKLPDNLKVGGSIYLSDCTKLTELPDNLKVVGDLRIDNTLITKLPNNLKVYGQVHKDF
jgi:hypothetical protein